MCFAASTTKKNENNHGDGSYGDKFDGQTILIFVHLLTYLFITLHLYTWVEWRFS